MNCAIITSKFVGSSYTLTIGIDININIKFASRWI
jgi:hypothetical protein